MALARVAIVGYNLSIKMETAGANGRSRGCAVSALFNWMQPYDSRKTEKSQYRRIRERSPVRVGVLVVSGGER